MQAVGGLCVRLSVCIQAHSCKTPCRMCSWKPEPICIVSFWETRVGVMISGGDLNLGLPGGFCSGEGDMLRAVFGTFLIQVLMLW